MPKTPDRLIELKRAVRTLLALDGRVLALHSGAWLVQRGQVRDPAALLDWVGSTHAPAAQTLQACFTPDTRCEPLHAQHLAAAQHAWSQLHAQRELLADTPARWLGGQRRDAVWLQAQYARLRVLGEVLRAPAQTPAALLAIWFAQPEWAHRSLSKRQLELALLDPGPLTQLPDADLGAVPEPVWRISLELICQHERPSCALAASLIAATARWEVYVRAAWWPWLVRGIAPQDVETWPPRERAAAAPPTDWPWPAVQVYVRLASDLRRVPGGGLPLPPEAFSRLPGARKPALVALASALDLSLRPAHTRDDAEQRLAWADLSLRLQGKPAQPPAPEPGLGGKIDPGFADWLADPTLDHYLTLRRALDQPLQVSTRLRQDYRALEQAETQRQFLSTLPDTDPRRAQLLRLARTADPARTRKRLQQECAHLELQWRLADADRQLQSLLTRVIGCALPPWTEAWRDGARLYLAVDHNHAELRTLLRAAASGTALALRRQLPGNAAWLEQAQAHLDVDAWLDPPSHSLPLRGQNLAIRAERDPLQALRMGLSFDSCLAIDEGCNRHSAIINALDANKWVVYVRDAQERIVARQLIGIASDWKLVGYRVYTSIGHTTELIAALGAYARDLGERASLLLADHGVPVTLNGRHWYDDGTHAWPAATDGDSNGLTAYCAGLGLSAPRHADPELQTEARRHALACAGRIEALPHWVDSYPSGVRNRQMLSARLGWTTLLRLLGDPRCRHDYELAQLSETDLHAQLTRIARWRPRHQGYLSLPLSVPVSRASLRLLCKLVETADPEQQLDDHGVEHALLRYAPAFAEAATLDALMAELPRVLSCFDQLARLLPDCGACIECAELGLLVALQRAWLRNRQPASALKLLATRAASARWPRLLLRLGASVHLEAPGQTPLFDPPRPAHSVQRALERLAQRDPQLRADPHYWVAIWRHGDPEQPLQPEVWPPTAPFDALGDLLLALPALWPVLRRYAPRPGELPTLDPLRACWHRQVPTAWRAGLPAQVAAGGDNALSAARLLVQINDAALIEQALAGCARPRGVRGTGAANPQAQARTLLQRAHAHSRLQRKLLTVEGDLDLPALARLWPALQAAGADISTWPTDWPLALTLHPEASLLTASLLQSEQLPTWAPAYLEVALGARMSMERYIATARFPALAALRDRAFPLSWGGHNARQHLQGMPADLAEHWLRSVLAAGDEELLGDGPPDWYQRLAVLARSACTPEVWLALYQQLPDALARSLFLQALKAADAPALRALLPTELGSSALDWLAHRLQQLDAMP